MTREQVLDIEPASALNDRHLLFGQTFFENFATLLRVYISVETLRLRKGRSQQNFLTGFRFIREYRAPFGQLHSIPANQYAAPPLGKPLRDRTFADASHSLQCDDH